MAFVDDYSGDESQWTFVAPLRLDPPDLPSSDGGRTFKWDLTWPDLTGVIQRSIRLSPTHKVLASLSRSGHDVLQCTFSPITESALNVTIKTTMSSKTDDSVTIPPVAIRAKFEAASPSQSPRERTIWLKYKKTNFPIAFSLNFSITLGNPSRHSSPAIESFQPLTSPKATVWSPARLPLIPDTPKLVLSPKPSFLSHGSEHSYVGLRNQGATCYLNSFLQALYQIPAFRKIIYQIPSETRDTDILFNLQRLFALLQTEHGPLAVGTELLTKSFGWSVLETNQQNDVQEFSRVLLTKLEEKMKGTPQDGALASLFQGKTRAMVICPALGASSMSSETFYDLSLVVKGCSDLDSSFAKYTDLEIVTGPNQYNVAGHGPQDAELRTRFLKFPPVLHCHLRRFEFNSPTNAMTKINSTFLFPVTLDLSKYLWDNNEHEGSTMYELFGVLVHSGNGATGHYYAFLRTSPARTWFEFNDSRVTQVTERWAIERNFGGEFDFSAYMLVYVQKSKNRDGFRVGGR
jgi:ubiquitin C-terminal hydrolase